MFNNNYSFRLDPDLPTSSDAIVRYFPGDSPAMARKLIEFVTSSGLKWYGLFSETNIYGKGITDVLATPNPDWAVVCVGGTGYHLSVFNPSIWSEVPLVGIDKYALALDDGILVLGSGTALVAYDSEGLRWKSPRVALDGFTLSMIRDHKIRCEAQEPLENVVELDILDGTVLKGAIPEEWSSSKA